MKEPVHSRGPNCEQHRFDGANFSPTNLEDSVILLINEIFEEDVNAVSSLDYKLDTDTAEPLLVLTSGDLEASKEYSAMRLAEFGKDMFPGSNTNAQSFEQLVSGTIAINCVTRTARSASDLGYKTLQFFQQLKYYMPEMLDILSFIPVKLTAPKKIEETEHMWGSAVQCSFTIGLAWSTERIAPRLKTFNLKGLETI